MIDHLYIVLYVFLTPVMKMYHYDHHRRRRRHRHHHSQSPSLVVYWSLPYAVKFTDEYLSDHTSLCFYNIYLQGVSKIVNPAFFRI